MYLVRSAKVERAIFLTVCSIKKSKAGPQCSGDVVICMNFIFNERFIDSSPSINRQGFCH